MLRDLPLPAPENAEDDRLLGQIEHRGWIVVTVSPNLDDPPGTPHFAYTAGLERTWDHPELIVLGLERREAYAALARAVERVAAGQPLEVGTCHDGIVAGRPVVVGPVGSDHRRHNLTYADWLYDREDFRAAQLVHGDEESLGDELPDLMERADAGDGAAARRVADLMWRYGYTRTADEYRAKARALGYFE